MAHRIYLVDDDKFLLDLYAVRFKNAGYEVQTFSGGEEALAALRKETEAPEALLLDIIMPGIDGFETVSAMRKERLATSSKVIFLSNQGLDSDIEKARELKADGYIVKASAIPSEVLTEVERILSGAPQTPK